jgi:hypothetical protein
MSFIKSSVINLYDGQTGNNLFQSKVSDDKVELISTTLPINLSGTSIVLKNEGGDTINDVVATITTALADLTRISTVESSFNSLFADVETEPLNTTYIFTQIFGSSYGIVGLTHPDGSALTNGEMSALVNEYFTYRDMQNTALIKFTSFTSFYPGLYTSELMEFVPIGSTFIVYDYVPATGPRDANYTVSSVAGQTVNFTKIGGATLSETEKFELVGRWFASPNHDSTQNRIQNSNATGLVVAYDMSAIPLGSNIFLI